MTSSDFRRACLQDLVPSLILVPWVLCTDNCLGSWVVFSRPRASSHTASHEQLPHAASSKPGQGSQTCPCCQGLGSQPCAHCLRYKWLVWWFSYNNLMVTIVVSEVVELGFASSFSQGIFKSTCPFPGCRQPLRPSYWSCATVQRRIRSRRGEASGSLTVAYWLGPPLKGGAGIWRHYQGFLLHALHENITE